MGTSGLKKCCGCGVWFQPHPRNRHHQHFCSKADGRTASKHQSQRKWIGKNRSYFRGPDQVARVRAWRKDNPGYGKKPGTPRPEPARDALQEVLIPQGFDRQGVDAFRIWLSQEISRPLQELLTAQGHTLVGLMAMMTGNALQEDIVRSLGVCYQKGQHIGGMMPWMSPLEQHHERKTADCAAKTTAHPPAV